MPQSEYWPFTNSKNVEDNITGGESFLLQRQVGLMEGEIKEIQMELAAIKKDRLFLTNRKETESEQICVKTDDSDFKNAIKVQDELEYGVKVSQVAQFHEIHPRTVNATDEELFQKEKCERKLRDLELKINSICGTGVVEQKETRKFPNEEVLNLRRQLKDTREEMAELYVVVTEKNDEVEEYRAKYMQAQQEVEELKQQIAGIEAENKQVSDGIQLEIQNVKNQFEEKLRELIQLPEMLKGAQIQLQQAKLLQELAEDGSKKLCNELNRVKEKLVVAVNSLTIEKAEKLKLVAENNTYYAESEMRQKELYDLFRCIDEYKCQVMRLEEKLSHLVTRYTEKTQECEQLTEELDQQRAENNRSITKLKERNDSMRGYLQTQITELEKQLVQARAQCKTFQKERDDIRQRMQLQVNTLQENYDIVEMRLHTLQNQVTALKHGFALILENEDEDEDLATILSI